MDYREKDRRCQNKNCKFWRYLSYFSFLVSLVIFLCLFASNNLEKIEFPIAILFINIAIILARSHVCNKHSTPI